MNRRSFLRWLGVGAVAVPTAVLLPDFVDELAEQVGEPRPLDGRSMIVTLPATESQVEEKSWSEWSEPIYVVMAERGGPSRFYYYDDEYPNLATAMDAAHLV
jgi:hypothetical protein